MSDLEDNVLLQSWCWPCRLRRPRRTRGASLRERVASKSQVNENRPLIDVTMLIRSSSISRDASPLHPCHSQVQPQ